MKKFKLLSQLFALVCAVSMSAETWTSLDDIYVIHYGDQIVVPAGKTWDINGGNYFRNNQSPYTLLRADLAYDEDDGSTKVTELLDGAYYVFKDNSGNYFYFPSTPGEYRFPAASYNSLELTNSYSFDDETYYVTFSGYYDWEATDPVYHTITWNSVPNLEAGQHHTDANGITLTVNSGFTDGGDFYNGSFNFAYAYDNLTRIDMMNGDVDGMCFEYANISASGWAINGTAVTWKGNSNSINFGKSVCMITSIKFTVEASNFAITANVDPQHPGDYYATFYDKLFKYTLPSGVEAYTAEVDGDALILHKIAEGGQVLPANTAVILKANSNSFTLTPSNESAVSIDETNNLHGVNVATSKDDIPEAGNTIYVLSGEDGVVGFYKYTGATLGAHKAYIALDAGGAAHAPRRLVFHTDETQGIDNANANTKADKLIENGQLIVIKNGVRYNAQGQIVK